MNSPQARSTSEAAPAIQWLADGPAIPVEVIEALEDYTLNAIPGLRYRSPTSGPYARSRDD